MIMKIGFIGLGNMGEPMANNLLQAGHTLVVADRVQAVVDRVVNRVANGSQGLAIRAADAAGVAASKADVLITVLPGPNEVREVYLGPAGILANLVEPTLLIDASTIDPQTSREVAKQAHSQGHTMLDAPVSGGTMGAKAGTLTFMVGGDALAYEKARPVLSAMGKNIVHCGDVGNGQVAKVANNMLLAISMIGTAEAMSLGVSLGMDPQVLAGIINTSSGRCWSAEVNNPYPGALENAPASRGYSGGFGTALMLKDLGLATSAAKAVGQPVMMGALAQQLYQAFTNQGHGQLDFSAIIRLLDKHQT
jgi:3-hydroxyisobutyrate dehydrogenase